MLSCLVCFAAVVGEENTRKNIPGLPSFLCTDVKVLAESSLGTRLFIRTSNWPRRAAK